MATEITDGSVKWVVRDIRKNGQNIAKNAADILTLLSETIPALKTQVDDLEETSIPNLQTQIDSISPIASYDVSNVNSWWVKFAGSPGLIIQGGRNTSTFPVAYSTTCFFVMVTIRNTATGWETTPVTFYVYSMGLTSFSAGTNGHWIALGY